ncbi:APC family permease [Pseudaquabacterium pictum]|uniref:Transporter n=1 Tax=Pseudaquabacterium pictum TaxID=2315236 RepID=A0A480ALP5_9BURK|nr:APC family permease [Rubrivivax pictus]GCL61660.1 transporter [Rubrivivax pictus]
MSSTFEAGAPTGGPQAKPATLKRSLGLFDLVAFGLVYMAVVAPLTTLGFIWEASGGLMAASYLAAALCMYFTARSYATMSEVDGSCGSVYSYTRTGLGDLAGFMAGWMILLDYVLTPALVFALMSVGMSTLVPSVDRATWIVLVLVVTLGLNWVGTQVAAKVSVASVIAQIVMVFGVLALAVVALDRGLGTGHLSAQPFVGTTGWPDLHLVLGGAALAVMTFLGFDAVSTLSEEVRSEDKRLVGRATMWVLALASGLYVLTAWVIGNLMPAIQVQDPAAAIFELLGQTVGPWAPLLFGWLLAMVVGFTNALPMLAGVSRVLFAMARNGQLPAPLGRIHAGTGVPRTALLVSSGVSLVVALLLRDRVDLLASLVSFGALAGFSFLHLSVLAHFARRGGPRRWFAHVIAPGIGLVLVVGLFIGMHREALWLGAAWFLAGLVYGLWLRQRPRPRR